MKSKKKNKQMDKRQDELFDALCEIVEMITITLNEHKTTIKETFIILNSLYARLCEMVFENRPEVVTEEVIKKWIVSQVDVLKDNIINKLPIKENEDEQE